MPNITTCSVCEKAYEEASEEAANQPYRLCPKCRAFEADRHLPPCRLCGYSPETCAPSLAYVRCSYRRCRLSHIDMTRADWRKLHAWRARP